MQKKKACIETMELGFAQKPYRKYCTQKTWV